MAATKLIQCISPIDGSVYIERPALTYDQASKIIREGREAQAAWATRPLAERCQLVLAGIERVGQLPDIVTELAWQMGRPVRYDGEYSGFYERGSYMTSIAKDSLKPLIVEDSDAFLRVIKREPCGSVLVIAPWNYPYMTAINTIAPALIAGNATFLKHAAQTLLVGERIEQAFHEAGVPPEIFRHLVLDHETTSQLIEARAFNFVNFTGSVGAGAAIERAAAGQFIGVGTELGGKDPAYVMDDADLDAAVATVIDGAMFNSGQCCCGIERIYVTSSLYDDFINQAVALVENYQLGNPLDPNTTLGPMAQQRFADEVRRQTQDAINQGARPLIDAKHFPENGGNYLMPQLLANVNHSMKVMQVESFGPVVGIMKVNSDDEAIALMNDSEFGLTASLWTQDVDRAERLGARIETGTVFMNRCDYVDPGLCWTGCKNTGRGEGLSPLAYNNLTRPKSYHFKKS
ncbi:MAG: aldehyde dehydrogenase family protein [Deinococcota bacterium]